MPGVLANLLDVLRDAGLNMTSFISRPIKGRDGTYSFIATIDAAPWQEHLRDVLTQVVDHGDWVKTLAVYPRRERPEPADLRVVAAQRGSAPRAAAPGTLDGRRHCAKGIAVVGSHDTAAAVRLTVGVIGLGLIGGSLAQGSPSAGCRSSRGTIARIHTPRPKPMAYAACARSPNWSKRSRRSSCCATR